MAKPEDKQPYVEKVRRIFNRMVKLGSTTADTSEERFTEEYQAKWFPDSPLTPLGLDWISTPLIEVYVPFEVAKAEELLWRQNHPKNIWTKVFYNGITECRYKNYKETKEIIEYLVEKYPKALYGEKKPGTTMLYFDILDRREPIELSSYQLLQERGPDYVAKAAK